MPFLDIAVGLLVASMLAGTFDLEGSAEKWYLAVGILTALLPDLDAVWHLFRRREVAAHAGSPEDHRDGLHYPLVYIPSGTILVWGMFGLEWGVLFLLTSLFHFLHDSVGTGWGVKWLWPISRRNYKCFCKKDGSPSVRLVISWDPHELREVIIQEGDPEWIQNLFLRPLWRAMTFKIWPPLGLTAGLLIEIILPVVIIAVFVSQLL